MPKKKEKKPKCNCYETELSLVSQSNKYSHTVPDTQTKSATSTYLQHLERNTQVRSEHHRHINFKVIKKIPNCT